MPKFWCICRICGASFMGMSEAQDDCGRNDAQHREARGQ